MSTTELRRAAEKLRQLSGEATEGPWESEYRTVNLRPDSPSPFGWLVSVSLQGNADYIATMHPGVGLALADWLDDAAQIYENEVNGGYGVSLKRLRGPLTVARLILDD